MMLHELLKSVVWVQPQAATAGFLSLSAAANTVLAEFHPAAPWRLLKWGFIASQGGVVSAGASSLVLQTTANPGATGVQVDTLTPGAQTIAAGNGGYRDFFTPSTTTAAIPSEVTNAGPLGVVGNNNVVSGQIQTVGTSGQGLVIAIGATNFTSGSALVFIEYVLLPIAKPSGYGFGATSPDGIVAGSVSLTDNLTRFAS